MDISLFHTAFILTQLYFCYYCRLIGLCFVIRYEEQGNYFISFIYHTHNLFSSKNLLPRIFLFRICSKCKFRVTDWRFFSWKRCNMDGQNRCAVGRRTPVRGVSAWEWRAGPQYLHPALVLGVVKIINTLCEERCLSK